MNVVLPDLRVIRGLWDHRESKVIPAVPDLRVTEEIRVRRDRRAFPERLVQEVPEVIRGR